MALVEIDGCIFDAKQLERSYGFESLDPVAKEAFVNHMHLTGDDRTVQAGQIIESWITEMLFGWPGRTFRIYQQLDKSEVTIRFHQVRPGLLNWCEEGIEIIIVGPTDKGTNQTLSQADQAIVP